MACISAARLAIVSVWMLSGDIRVAACCMGGRSWKLKALEVELLGGADMGGGWLKGALAALEKLEDSISLSPTKVGDMMGESVTLEVGESAVEPRESLTRGRERPYERRLEAGLTEWWDGERRP